MSNFKIALTTFFIFCFVVGVILFATSKAKKSPGEANLLVWGTVSSDVFSAAYSNASVFANKSIKVTYVKKDSVSFDTELVNALADGSGPDVVILRDDSMYKSRNKIYPIPYKSYSERDFKDKFIQGGEVFLSPSGVGALPFMVDPLVMYWNRDMFSNANIAQTPQYWDQVFDLINKMTRKDNNANVLQSAIALGGWSNITNAKEILLTALFQAGTPVVSRDAAGTVSVLNSALNYTIPPGSSAVDFYTQFSNPTAAGYTWNRSLPSSQNFFLSGDLAMYLGFASEIGSIQQKNSNLNFDVTFVPQIRNTQKKTVFGHIFGLAIVKQSKQIQGAFTLILSLTEPAAIKAMEALTDLPPVRRDLLSDKPSDAFRSVFYDSALISQTWIDPDPIKSSNTFRDMIEAITSGRERRPDAMERADQELNAALK